MFQYHHAITRSMETHWYITALLNKCFGWIFLARYTGVKEKRAKTKLTDYLIDACSSNLYFHPFSVNTKGYITTYMLFKISSLSITHTCYCFEALLPLFTLNKNITLSLIFLSIIWLTTNWVLEFSVENILVNQTSPYMLRNYWLYAPSVSNGTVITDEVIGIVFLLKWQTVFKVPVH